MRPAHILALLLALVAGGIAPAPARADLMATCAPDIQKNCSAIDRGRGRITACLAAYSGKISAACRTEVQSAVNGPLTPRDVRAMLGGGFSAPLPAACTSAAASFCPGVPGGDGRVFACLYANSNRVDKACNTAARAAVK